MSFTSFIESFVETAANVKKLFILLISSTDKNPPQAGKAYKTREITIYC